ncbi:MAG: hypothetical protein F9K30_09345 [Dechloromonas sp.]|nr:MAG: hypothetical protein F9K30_09345 [Dechloromonas sp.]
MTYPEFPLRLVAVSVVSVTLHVALLAWIAAQWTATELSYGEAISQIKLFGKLSISTVSNRSTLQKSTPNLSPVISHQKLPSIDQTETATALPSILAVPSEVLDQAIDFDIPPELPETFPESAEGSVNLTILVGENGQVLWLKAEQAEFPPEILASVEDVFFSARFKPPIHRGIAVKTLVRMAIQIAPLN